MHNTKKFFVANWKMEKTPAQAVSWVQDALSELDQAARDTQSTVVLCPSFTALGAVAPFLRSTSVALGAQDCSMHERGAFTGQESAVSLKELNCSYCIIGHSERRAACNEQSNALAKKADLLLKHGITPLICIGETGQERAEGKTFDTLTTQLDPIIEELAHTPYTAPLSIAYEPVWAVGTQQTISVQELTDVIQWLKIYLDEKLQKAYTVLYGGNVTIKNARFFSTINSLDGLLLGRASLDKQQFLAIMRSLF